MKFVCESEVDLSKIADLVLVAASENRSAGAFVIGLYGNLGSGKTTFTKYLAKALRVKETITSPTFILQKNFNINWPKKLAPQKSNEKSVAPERFKKLYHFDVYRIDSEKELASLHWPEIISNPQNIVVIEWPERVAGSLPSGILKIKFTFVDESTREVEIDDRAVPFK